MAAYGLRGALHHGALGRAGLVAVSDGGQQAGDVGGGVSQCCGVGGVEAGKACAVDLEGHPTRLKLRRAGHRLTGGECSLPGVAPGVDGVLGCGWCVGPAGAQPVQCQVACDLAAGVPLRLVPLGLVQRDAVAHDDVGASARESRPRPHAELTQAQHEVALTAR